MGFMFSHALCVCLITIVCGAGCKIGFQDEDVATVKVNEHCGLYNIVSDFLKSLILKIQVPTRKLVTTEEISRLYRLPLRFLGKSGSASVSCLPGLSPSWN